MTLSTFITSDFITRDTADDGPPPSSGQAPERAAEAYAFNVALPRPGDIIGGKYVVASFCRREGIAVECTATSIDAPGGIEARVDIRMLAPEWTGHAAVVEQFLQAGRAASTLSTRHAERVFDVGTMESGAPYFVLEHLTGFRIDEILSRRGAVPEAAAVDWILQAAEALAEVHACGVAHLDLKPSRLTLAHGADGTRCIKVRDFGLLRVTDALRSSADHRVMFAPDALEAARYLSPEQMLTPDRSDCRADVWSLGAILHGLISGRAPFEGASVETVCAAVLGSPPTRLSLLHAHVSPVVERAVLRCLEKDADRRFANVSQFAHALTGAGTSLARASRMRIDATLGLVAAPLALPAAGFDQPSTKALAAPGTTELEETALRSPASARVVLLALVLMAVLGGAGFGLLHARVHGPGASPQPLPGWAALR